MGRWGLGARLAGGIVVECCDGRVGARARAWSGDSLSPCQYGLISLDMAAVVNGADPPRCGRSVLV